jgi:stearoyl-CoA desaturase (delta-9 desaturase)
LLEFILLFVAFYVWHILGVTIGLHRLLAHRAFRCVKPVEHFWVSGAYLAFHGSPIWWASIHRAHHRYVETPLDPHAPSQGIVKAYTFFTPFKYNEEVGTISKNKDLVADPIYRFLEQGGNWKTGYALNVFLCLLFRAVLWAAFGPIVAGASLLAGVFALNMPLALNVICHIKRLGYRNFETQDDSVNVWWMAIFTLGDGWHNNHHAFPASTRSGVKWYEVDPSWLTLCLLRKLRLVSTMNETSRSDISRWHSSRSSIQEPELARR